MTFGAHSNTFGEPKRGKIAGVNRDQDTLRLLQESGDWRRQSTETFNLSEALGSWQYAAIDWG
jgi:hypothetical protein